MYFYLFRFSFSDILSYKRKNNFNLSVSPCCALELTRILFTNLFQTTDNWQSVKIELSQQYFLLFLEKRTHFQNKYVGHETRGSIHQNFCTINHYRYFKSLYLRNRLRYQNEMKNSLNKIVLLLFLFPQQILMRKLLFFFMFLN